MPFLSEAAVRLLFDLRAGRPIHILDVGANPLEKPAYKSLVDLGLARVTGFEPQPSALAELNRAKGPNETYLPYVVGDGSMGQLHITQGSGFTSLFPPLVPNARLVGVKRLMNVLSVEQLPTRALDFMQEVDPVDFLKIDVQGAELSVIRHAREKLSSAIAVQTEVRFLPIYEGEPSYGALNDELTSQGFVFHDFHAFNRKPLASENAARLAPRSGATQIVDADAIYLRDLARNRQLSDEQLFTLAILATGVLDRPGVAVHALDLLKGRGRIVQSHIDSYLDSLPADLVRKAPPGRTASVPDARAIMAKAGRKVMFSAVKNEGPFLLEWIAYHKAIGFDHMVIFYNDCDDGSAELLESLNAAGVIEAHQHAPGEGVGAQGNAARLADEMKVFRDGDWILWLDADEFLNVHVGNGRIDDLVATIAPNVGILIPWRLFGDGGVDDFDGRFISERFVTAANPPTGEAPEIKTMFQMGPHIRGFGVHRPALAPRFRIGASRFLGGNGRPLNPDLPINIRWTNGHQSGNARVTDMTEFGWELVQINHYLVRTPALYLLKKARGDGLRVGWENRRLTEDFYRESNQNEAEDRTILRHLTALEANLSELREVPGVRAAEETIGRRLDERLDRIRGETRKFSEAVHARGVLSA